MEKSSTEERAGACEAGGATAAIVNKVVQGRFTEKVTFES